MTDILTKGFDRYIEWAQYLSEPTYGFFYRISSLFIPVCICAAALRYTRRTVFIQALCFCGGLILAFRLPILVPTNDVAKGFLVSVLIVSTLSVPSVLPMYLARTPLRQGHIRFFLYSLLIVLFLLNPR